MKCFTYFMLTLLTKPGFSVISSLEPAQDRAKSSAKFMPSSSDEPLQKMAIASGEFTHMIPTTGNMMQMVDDTGRIQTVDLLEQPAPVVFNSANVKFLLYTRLNPTNPIPIKTDKEYLPEMFNPSYETIFVIHGWKGSTQNVEDITKGYMRTRGNYNVIVVDWAIPSRDGYTTASYTSILVGGTVAKFIDYLASNGLRPSNVNIVGFSMGAHVAGTAGSRITSGKIGKITGKIFRQLGSRGKPSKDFHQVTELIVDGPRTRFHSHQYYFACVYNIKKYIHFVGLDPAGPVFDLFPAGDKLTSDDADFVQVIHTNVGRFGYVGDLGHVDFYPNGGSVQNGCDQQTTLDSVLDFCNHLRSKEYYVESLTSKRVFNATMCYSWIDYSKRRCYRNPTAAMGAYTPNSSRGRYYVRTNSYPPFAM